MEEPLKPEPRQIAGELGLASEAIRLVEPLSERHGHFIWRLKNGERSYVLKWFPPTDTPVEIEAYRLLQKLGVPTLPLCCHNEQALLLEDLTQSESWRLAVAADLVKPEVGRAVARWYRALHDAGETLLAQEDHPRFLQRESDLLQPDMILDTGRSLGLSNSGVWELAAEHIALLRAAAARLSITLNYNDFYWTNLALSRRCEGRLEAIVFDYHLLGIGMRYSDWRNVTGSLSGGAVSAFRDAYGLVDPREETLDRPLATLHTLHVATRTATFPGWARSSRQCVLTGELEADLVNAIALARALV